MRLTFRAKLTVIIGIAALALALVTIVGAASARRGGVDHDAVQRRYLPKIEFGPQLEADFERLRRSFQDAVAAHDKDALLGTQELEASFLRRLDQAKDIVAASDLAELRAAMQDYYAAAYAVSARLVADETGEALLDAMAVMQQKQQRAREQLERVTFVDRAGLAEAFASIARAQSAAGALCLWISLSCLVAAMVASLGLGRGVLRSLTDLSAALQRFGEGRFDRGVEVRGDDELAQVARQANRMAENLDRLTHERRRAEAALTQSNADLEAFSYSVAHDLRAPLRAISGFSQTLIEDLGERVDADAKDLLIRISAAAERMGHLIDGLLAMSRVSRVALRRHTVDLTQAAAEIMRHLRASSPERSVDFANQPEVSAEGDPVLLRAVLDNLLGNSWKFTGAKAEAHISFGCRLEDGQTIYFVKDDGAGFDMAHADKLFAPFQRLHRATEFAGTGIGLATVDRIIRRHGGRIWAEGTVNHGSAFYFTLPRRGFGDVHGETNGFGPEGKS